jgi:AcrR family transcriptional regulator
VTVVDNITAQRDPAISSGAPVTGIDAETGIDTRTGDSAEPAAHQEHAAHHPHGGGAGAKDRILATANELFYYEGIRAVGVDRLISESRVTKATFYKHFGAKETLIVSYLNSRHDSVREMLAEIVSSAASAEDAFHGLVGNIVEQVHDRQFRGCPFINAAIEFPDSHHVVREVVASHRDWYTAFIADLFRRLGHPMPGDAADEFVLLRDGTMSGGYASDPIAASAAMQRSVDRLLKESHPPLG